MRMVAQSMKHQTMHNHVNLMSLQGASTTLLKIFGQKFNAVFLWVVLITQAIISNILKFYGNAMCES